MLPPFGLKQLADTESRTCQKFGKRTAERAVKSGE